MVLPLIRSSRFVFHPRIAGRECDMERMSSSEEITVLSNAAGVKFFSVKCYYEEDAA